MPNPTRKTFVPTPDELADIVTRYQAGQLLVEIAAIYGVSKDKIRYQLEKQEVPLRTTQVLTCTTCNKEFPRNPKGAPRTYCDECKPSELKRETPRKKNCRLCGSEFYGVRSRHYCTPECRSANKLSTKEQRHREIRNAMDMATEKWCNKCDRTLPKSMFRKDRSRIDGLHPYCIECWRTYAKKKDTPVTQPRFASKAEYDRWYRDNRVDLSADAYRDQYLYATYRITQADYAAILERQGGRCAICGATDGGHQRGRSNGHFAVDHDHSCCPGSRSCGECVRGLLCRNCNFGLGNLRDDVGLLIAAIDYLNQHSTAASKPADTA